MKRSRRTARTGAALLITLVTLVLTFTAITGVAALATSYKLEREFDRLGRMAGDLLFAADEVILDWLSSESANVVLPPEAGTPEILILHEMWTAGSRHTESIRSDQRALEIELRITAWDQCGMVPLNMAKAGSPLRLVLPEHVLQAIDSMDSTRDQHVGLDRFAMPLDIVSLSPFPLPEAGDQKKVRVYGESSSTGPSSRLRYQDQGPSTETAIGAFVSTDTQSMNLNTTPIAVLEQALRQAGRGGIEVVVAARSAGHRVSLASLPAQGDAQATTVRFTSASDAWAFRIDARVGVVQRSWWAVYKPAQSRSRNQSSRRPAGAWECVQRMVIRD